MTFISYAQNFEDIVLHRALLQVKKGFYIDVGAQDPVTDSVTKAFYDAGWRGINIEPVSEWFEKLQRERPEDFNLKVAAGACEGESDFFEVHGTGLSTMIGVNAARHAKELGLQVTKRKVQVRTLTSICQQYGCSEVHFLKIDVEGTEREVLQGLNLEKFRPWIILVEATVPATSSESHFLWEPLLNDAGYVFAYFDGLNRFYLSDEHVDLLSQLAIPPNVFDLAILSGTATSIGHRQVMQIKTRLGVLEEKLAEADQQRVRLESENQSMQSAALDLEELVLLQNRRISELEEIEMNFRASVAELEAVRNAMEHLSHLNTQLTQQVQFAEDQLRAVHASMSWLVTLPLRKLADLAKWILTLPSLALAWIAHFLIRCSSLFIRGAMSFVLGRPRLLRWSTAWYQRHPKLGAKLSMLAHQSQSAPDSLASDSRSVKLAASEVPESCSQGESDLINLTLRAQHVYRLMQKELAARRAGVE